MKKLSHTENLNVTWNCRPTKKVEVYTSKQQNHLKWILQQGRRIHQYEHRIPSSKEVQMLTTHHKTLPHMGNTTGELPTSGSRGAV